MKRRTENGKKERDNPIWGLSLICSFFLFIRSRTLSDATLWWRLCVCVFTLLKRLWVVAFNFMVRQTILGRVTSSSWGDSRREKSSDVWCLMSVELSVTQEKSLSPFHTWLQSDRACRSDIPLRECTHLVILLTWVITDSREREFGRVNQLN